MGLSPHLIASNFTAPPSDQSREDFNVKLRIGAALPSRADGCVTAPPEEVATEIGAGAKAILKTLSLNKPATYTLPALNSAVQGVIHRLKDLIHGDPAVFIGVPPLALRRLCVAEGDVHHGEDVVHGDVSVTGAISDAWG
jgi:hypothetical protein